MEDAELLKQYADEGSESAFAELVRRHLNLVYSAALRQVGGDAHRAEDIAQAVFTALARDAAALSRRPVVISWLYATTRFIAARTLRDERRRQRREEKAQVMDELTQPESSDVDWLRVRPVLDEAMHALNARDRDAVLLRFFAGIPLAEIGVKLGVTEDAAQKRVQRALERLRRLLARHGVTSTEAALAVALTQQAVVAAPAGLAAAIGNPVVAGATLAPGVFTLLKIMSLSKTIVGIISALAVAGTAGLVLQQRTISQLRTENRDLRQQNQAAHDSRENRLTEAEAATTELKRVHQEDEAELAKTRAELAALRKRAEAFARARAARASENASGLPPLQGPMTPVAAGKSSGSATAVDAFKSAAAAVAQGDIDLLAAMTGFDPQGRAAVDTLFAKLPEATRAQYGSPEKVFATLMAAKLPQLTSVGLVSQNDDGPDDTLLRMRMQNAAGLQWDDTFPLHRGPNGWQIVVSARAVAAVSETLMRSSKAPDESKSVR